MRKRKPSNAGGYSCMKCGSTAIYLSRTPQDLRGTLSCTMCGGTEDAEIGIAKNGHRVETHRNPLIKDYFDAKRKHFDKDHHAKSAM